MAISPLNRGVRHVNMDVSARPPLPRKVDMDPSARPDRPRRMSAEELEMQSVIDKHGGEFEVRRKAEAASARIENAAMGNAPRRIKGPKRDIKSVSERAAEVRASEKAQSGLGGWVSKLTGGMGRVDDAVQGLIRDQVLRLPTDSAAQSGPFKQTRSNIGMGLFRARPGFEKDTIYKLKEGSNLALYGTRAAQVGLTAAGAGLAKLTLDIAGEFGGPADSPAPSELRP